MLTASLDVGVESDGVTFELVVENESDETDTLSFRTGQRTRFIVTPVGGGEPVWISDADQMFMQMLGEETVPAHGSVSFGEVWKSPESGEYRVEGEVTCDDESLTAETEFSV